MRVVITGATGNVGTSLLAALADQPEVREIVGIARRKPTMAFAKTTFVTADVARDDLRGLFAGAGAVVHLAWRVTPSHRLDTLTRTNIGGSRRVFDAVVDAGVPALIHASSVGAYSPGPEDGAVDEAWPIQGIHTSTYSRQKAEVERMLDELERAESGLRVVRLRPVLTFKREAASHIHRSFLGRLVPRSLFDRRLLKVAPSVADLEFQCVHSLDVGRAYAAAIVRDVRGAFNLAAEPTIVRAALRELFDNRDFAVKPAWLRRAAKLSWRLHLQPAEPGWLDMAFQVPFLDCRRAANELDWQPRFNALETLDELIEGLRLGAGLDTPPLAPRAIRQRAPRLGAPRGAEA